jgi:cold shock CspA family protein
MARFRLIPLLLTAIASSLTASTSQAGPEVRGDIAGVDLAKNELRVDGRGPTRGATLTFTLDEKTLVLFGARKAATTDLQAGRRVRVEYEEDSSGQRIARVIRVNGRPPAAPAVTAVPPVAGPAGEAITGALQRVSRADREVVVIGPGPKGPESETTVTVPESAKVVKEGKPASLDALREGDAVAIRVEHRDGRLTALEVQAGPGAALSAAATTERGRMVPRIRQALHIADEVLRRIDTADPDRGGPQKP